MAFQGSLDTVGLADVFQLFAFAKKSGALHLENGRERGVVYFAGGDVYFATLNPGDSIGNVLVRAGLVTAEQWRRVVATAREDVSQGEALVGLPDVDPDALEAFFREWVEDAVFTLLRWKEGDYRLEADQHTLGPVFLFGVDPVLEGAQGRLEQWESIEAAIPSTTMGVVMAGDMPGTASEVTLQRDEWRLLARLTPGASIGDLAASLGETEFRTCQTLHGLLSAQLVELVPAEKLAMMRSLVAAEPEPAVLEPWPGEAVPEPSAETVAPPPPSPPAQQPLPPQPPGQFPPPPAPPSYTPAPAPEPTQGATLRVEPPPAVRECPPPPAASPPPRPASLADLVTAAEQSAPAPPVPPPGPSGPRSGEQGPVTAPPQLVEPRPDVPGPPARSGAVGEAEGENGGGEATELNKSTILRLIAGVRNL